MMRWIFDEQAASRLHGGPDMLNMLKAAVITAAMAGASALTPAHAADLGGGGGSLKDAWVVPAQRVAGPCYARTDVGYSWSQTPNSQYVGNVDPSMFDQSLSDGWFTEAGLGCGSGSRGWRGELMFGLREEKDFRGGYSNFPCPVPGELSTNIKTYTMMFNGYYDLGNMNGFVPYVGAGLGWAYHKMDDVFSDVTTGIQNGEDKLSFAWSVMAGFGYQLTDRVILDVGYRYIDLGSARSSNIDNVFAPNPRLEVNDMTAHEIKFGVRYHFGSSDGYR
jgi:opacity protein-like surface antigen